MKPIEYFINKIFCKDNIIVLKEIPSESIDLVYIDPPFYSKMKWNDFNDCWDSISEYIEYIKLRIIEIHRILKKTGSLYVHCDDHACHYLKIMTDEIFGYSNFVNTITWKRARPQPRKEGYSNTSDFILFYAKRKFKNYFNQQYKKLSKSSIKRYNKEDQKGKYLEMTITCPLRDPNNRQVWNFGLNEKEPSRSREYAFSRENINKGIENGTIYKNTNGSLVRKRYLQDSLGTPVTSIWTDINHIMMNEMLFYDTQKPVKLIKRIIASSSKKNDIVLDAFCGSGTTCIASYINDRRFIGIDINPKAIEITKKRLTIAKKQKNKKAF